MSLDDSIRAGRPLAVAGRIRLRGRQRGQYRDDPLTTATRSSTSRTCRKAATGPWKPIGHLAWSISRCVHLDREGFPDSSLASVEKWASGIPVPTYAIDDATAVKIIEGDVEVVSEGHWKLFAP
jgi:hypothetical protein